MTAVEFVLNLVIGVDPQGKDVRVKDSLTVDEIKQAKEMEKEQIDKSISDEFNNHIRRTTTMHELVIQNCINNGDIIPFDDTKHEKKYDNLKERNGRFG